jgi:peptidoglycan/xylan/chitin deacetylase (PgdA/CDA1 family)
MKATAMVAAGLLSAALPTLTFLTPVRALFPTLRGIGSAHHVALTFDDGPDPRSTPRFLDLLARRGVHATFFLVGEQLTRNSGLAREITAAGHEVAVHGWHHRRTVRDDLVSAYELIASASGRRPRWYRPPYGVLTWPGLLDARRLGLTPVLWTTWGRDWTSEATAGSVFERVNRTLRGGATVLLHDSDRYAAVGSWRATLGAVPLLLDECERRQLVVGPLREHGLEDHRDRSA